MSSDARELAPFWVAEEDVFFSQTALVAGVDFFGCCHTARGGTPTFTELEQAIALTKPELKYVIALTKSGIKHDVSLIKPELKHVMS